MPRHLVNFSQCKYAAYVGWIHKKLLLIRFDKKNIKIQKSILFECEIKI